VVTLRDALDRWGRETLLLYFMRGHWSKPIDFSDEAMDQAAAEVETFRNAFISPAPRIGSTDPPEALDEALADNFDTANALSILHAWRRAGFVDWVADGLEIFGLSDLVTVEAAPHAVHQLAAARATAREQRDFERADRLREEIAGAGWEVRDIETEPGYQLVPK
jgi:cysteinyl-tRNA synthetase